MHQINVFIYGPVSFLSTLDELKPFLKFNPHIEKSNIDHDIILFHDEVLKNKEVKELINQSKCLKICVSNKIKVDNEWDAQLKLPATLKEINFIVENTSAKRTFNKNSSIAVKNYLLNKNEKKLTKDDISIILTEKEIQLIELLLENFKPISKNTILSIVWNYSKDADTHTVETHIYRLRKKVSKEFGDDKFIINNKDGYSL
tara:strand:+ start:2696 stop:3301 length:606 start_codon:yes stop_codon:yes gene_type:complete